MKQIFNIVLVWMSLSTSAYATPKYVQGEECAAASAEAARAFAAAEWNTSEAAIKIETSEIMHSSNPAPIEIYAVGLLSPSRVPVLFDVAVENNDGVCTLLSVDFSEFLQ